MASYRYMRLLPLDQVDAARGPGGAGGMHQGVDVGAALGLLAVLGMVGGAKRAHALAVAERRPARAPVDDVDQIGIDDDGLLRLGERLGRLGRLRGVEQL